jgi:sulfatase modifying factor 1
MNKKRRADKASKLAGRQNRVKIVVCLAMLLAGLGFWKFANRQTVQATQLPQVATAEALPMATTGFAATVENTKTPAGSTPEGMAWIPGGEYSMGAQDPPAMDQVGMQATIDSRPIHRVYVDGFWMDKTDVTNGEFAEFVKATGYVTVAERKPRAEDFPGAPPENLVRDRWFSRRLTMQYP